MPERIDNVRGQALHVLRDYFERGVRDDSTLIRSCVMLDPGGKKRWTKRDLATAVIHDEDYRVFSHQQDERPIIIDAGAHFGYSAVSIWASGCRARVLSFEPNPAYRDCLSSLKQLVPRQFDFHVVGLSDIQSTVEYVVPVLNDVLLGAFCTMNPSPNLADLAEHVAFFDRRYGDHRQVPFFRLLAFPAPIMRLDHVLSSHSFCVSTDDVFALKVDVEGSEALMLRGAWELLSTQHPLVLVERGESETAVNDLLFGLGYRMAARRHSALQLTSRSQAGVNAFFCHPSRFDEYRSCGLLLTSC